MKRQVTKKLNSAARARGKMLRAAKPSGPSARGKSEAGTKKNPSEPKAKGSKRSGVRPKREASVSKRPAQRPSSERDAAQDEAESRVVSRNLPIVVITGRPNVGKSTLFNRLVGKRKAIVDPTPGVTRDPVESECVLRNTGKKVIVVDTGGFKLDKEELDSLVIEKSLDAVERADVVLFVVDVMATTPEDEEFALFLRKNAAHKVLLVINKADSPERDALAYSAVQFGFRDIVFISAEHGRNISELEELVVSRCDFSKVEESIDTRSDIRFAILGKPNTGKSTLLNRLLGNNRSIVSDIPGTTRDVVEGSFEWKKRSFTVLDTAGIRRKGKVTENVEYYSVNRSIKTISESDVIVLMIDAREGLTDQDKKIAALSAEKGRGMVFALNKWDEMPKVANTFEASVDRLRYFFGHLAFVPVVKLSAKDGTGVDTLIKTIVKVHDQLTKRIETGKLNKAVEEWIERYPPPVGPKTRFKVRFAAQTSVNPLHFVFFVSRPDAVNDSYVQYLRNRIREDLGFDSVPILLDLRDSHGKPPELTGR